ncbi:MAG TPA: murein biosynthesis integral membrane protein MurJ [Peptococcaceae bacterium]|nr:MAG: Virulence factor MviN [Clostridia bacterium 41_269]HBT20321.1 murein biosynthesis integral membrane protein MurJ [Peptococcaceae bacterium]
MSRNSVVRAAGIVMVSMVLSRILGYIRDVVIYYEFGQNQLTDAYNAAFSIPDFLYMMLVGGALSSAFIPVFSSYLANCREEDAWRVASIIFNLVITLMLLGIAVGMIFTPQLIKLLVPGFSPRTAALTVKLTRIMFIQALFMGLSGISMGILHSYKHFLMPAVGSVLYNLSIVLLGWILSKFYGIAGFSLGVVVGAVLNFAVQLPKLYSLGLRYSFSFNIFHPGVRKIFELMLPVLVGLSVTQFNLFVNQNLASRLSPGIVAALRTGQRLMQLPIGIFAVAVAVAVFPTLTEYAAKGEMNQFKKTMSLGVRSVIFLTLPAAAGLIALRVPIVRLLFEQGKFTREATLATSYALLFYSIGLFGYSAQQVLNRTFYAIQDTLTPVKVGVLTILLNIVLNFILLEYLSYGGLALAYSLAGIFNMAALLYYLRKKIGSINGRAFLISFFQTLVSSVIMAVVGYYTAVYIESILDMSYKINQLIQVSLSIAVSVVVFAALSFCFRAEEMFLVLNILSRRFKGNNRMS